METTSAIKERDMDKTFEVRNVPGPIGAEIFGLDVSKPISDELFRGEILPILHDRSVVIFRDQKLNEDQHVAFSRKFGQLMRLETLGTNLMKGRPEIFVISNVFDDKGANIGLPDAGQSWHVDASYEKIPSYVSLFYGIEIPRDDAGNALGDTDFASAAAAYEELPDEMKARITGLKAVHRSVFYTDGSRHRIAKVDREEMDRLLSERNRSPSDVYPDVVHPVVSTDPATGKKSLFVNEGYTIRIVGMPRDESDALLHQLFSHVTAPQFVYSHNWRERDLVIWDNVAVQHKATFNYKLPQRRLMHRTTVLGTALIE